MIRITNITMSIGRDGKVAYALIETRSAAEAQSLLGEGETDVFHAGQWVRVKPIAIGAKSTSVCCKIMEVKK